MFFFNRENSSLSVRWLISFFKWHQTRTSSAVARKKLTEAVSMIKFSSQIFSSVFLSFFKKKTKEMTGASGSVNLILAAVLTSNLVKLLSRYVFKFKFFHLCFFPPFHYLSFR